MRLRSQRLKDQIADDVMVSGQFHLKSQTTQRLGVIWRPETEVSLWSSRYQQWQRYSVLLDTGADYSLFPRYVAALLGIELAKMKTSQTQGVGGTETVFFVEGLKLKISQTEREIPIGFVNSNQVPPLLGRHACLDTFTLVFDGRNKVLLGENKK